MKKTIQKVIISLLFVILSVFSANVSVGFENPYKDWVNPYKDWVNPYKDWVNPYGEYENPYGEYENPYGEYKNPYSFWENPFQYFLNWLSHWLSSIFGNLGHSNKIKNQLLLTKNITNPNNNQGSIQSRKLINTDKDKEDCNGKIETINGKEYCVVTNPNHSPTTNGNQGNASNPNYDPNVENPDENINNRGQNPNNQGTANIESNNINGNHNINANNFAIGSPVIINTDPCIGITPKNSELCPGHDKGVYFYERKHLVDVCSPVEESGPRCQYVCKTEHLADGTCKEEGYFKKVLNWFGGLF